MLVMRGRAFPRHEFASPRTFAPRIHSAGRSRGRRSVRRGVLARVARRRARRRRSRQAPRDTGSSSPDRLGSRHARSRRSRVVATGPTRAPAPRVRGGVRARARARGGASSASSASSSASSASSSSSAPLPPPSFRDAGPGTPTPTYADSSLDRFWRRQFHARVAAELGDDPAGVTGDYDATMARFVRLVSGARTPEEARRRGYRVLRSLLPPGPRVQTLHGSYRNGVARHAAAVTPFILPWLVGPAEVIDAPPVKTTSSRPRRVDDPVFDASDVTKRTNAEDAANDAAATNATNAASASVVLSPVDDPAPPPANALRSIQMALFAAREGDAAAASALGEVPGYKQGVLLERCRVLAEGGCASVCLNVCKLPTQQFFNEDVGLAVTLEPDYETFECRFVYGKTPKPPERDEAFDTPCFARCPISKQSGGEAFSGRGLPRWASADEDEARARREGARDRLPSYAGRGGARRTIRGGGLIGEGLERPDREEVLVLEF